MCNILQLFPPDPLFEMLIRSILYNMYVPVDNIPKKPFYNCINFYIIKETIKKTFEDKFESIAWRLLIKIKMLISYVQIFHSSIVSLHQSDHTSSPLFFMGFVLLN